MGKAQALEQNINSVLQKTRFGTPKSRVVRGNILRRIIDDLKRIGYRPTKIENIDFTVLPALIKLWQKDELSDSTISNQISILRSILHRVAPDRAFPSNQSLNIAIKRDVQNAVAYIEPNIINQLSDPYVKNLCWLQYWFGLKKSEAISFNRSCVINGDVIIYRKIAYNSKQRVITISNEAQREFLTSFLTELESQLNVDSSVILKLYNASIAALGIEHQEYFRVLYAHRRYSELTRKNMTEQDILKQLREELGCSENRTVRRILQCLESS
jgi:site-specific recombinase XerD